jgi:uncharacterized protein (DUF2235 family)
MALYAFDGTWNSAKDDEDKDLTNTNVVRFYQAYKTHSNTDDFYLAGVGTRLKLIGKIFGGVFGLGVLPRINEAYDHLCQRWAAGDHIIDIVGFSRGAATTLDFCHRIQEDGIRRPNSDDVVEPNPRIRFLGVWDIVAAFGLANLGAIDLNIGHHLELPASMVEYCFHAMAIDERRPSFLQTRLNGANEVWFRGVHSDVGGGNKNRGLNDIALKWMMNKAKAAGLPITDDDIAALAPNPATLPHPDHKLPLNVRVISAVDRVHSTITRLDDWTNPPATCLVETPADELKATEVGAIEVLPPAMRRYVAVLWETAVAAAAQLNFPIEGATDALLTLFQGRCILITNENQLNDARNATVKLVAAMVQGAQAHSFHNLTEFFLTEALFQLRPLYPFTD